MALAVAQLGASKSGAGVSALTSDSVSPSSNSLIGIIAASKDGGDPAATAPTSSGLTNLGSWVSVADAGNGLVTGSYDRIFCRVVQVTGAAGTGTATFNWSASQSFAVAVFFEITGHNTGAGPVQSATNNGTSSAITTTLGASPGGASLVIGGASERDSVSNIVVPSGWAELAEVSSSTGITLNVGYKIGSASQTPQWTNLGTTANAALAFEVALASIGSAAGGAPLLMSG